MLLAFCFELRSSIFTLRLNVSFRLKMLDSTHREVETPPPTPTIRQQHYMTLRSTASNMFSRFKSFSSYYYNKNRKILLFTILAYMSDFLLFFSINFYLFTNNNYLFLDKSSDKTPQQNNSTASISTDYPATTRTTPAPSTIFSILTATTKFIETQITTNGSVMYNQTSTANNLIGNTSLVKRNIPSTEKFSTPIALNTNQSESSPFLTIFKSELKQSYLSLQIITIFIFFFYFILNVLLKILFKYHKYEIRVYKNSINNYIEYDDQDSDDDDDDADDDDLNNKEANGIRLVPCA